MDGWGRGTQGTVSEGCLSSEVRTSEFGLEDRVLAVTFCWKGTGLALLSLKLVRTRVHMYVCVWERYYLNSVVF